MSNERSGASPGIRHRTSRPSSGASLNPTERASRQRRSGGAVLSRQWATRVEGDGSQWSRSNIDAENPITSPLKAPCHRLRNRRSRSGSDLSGRQRPRLQTHNLGDGRGRHTREPSPGRGRRPRRSRRGCAVRITTALVAARSNADSPPASRRRRCVAGQRQVEQPEPPGCEPDGSAHRCPRSRVRPAAASAVAHGRTNRPRPSIVVGCSGSAVGRMLSTVRSPAMATARAREWGRRRASGQPDRGQAPVTAQMSRTYRDANSAPVAVRARKRWPTCRAVPATRPTARPTPPSAPATRTPQQATHRNAGQPTVSAHRRRIDSHRLKQEGAMSALTCRRGVA